MADQKNQQNQGGQQGQAYWTCPVDNFQARNEQEKRDHIKKTENDPKHMEQEEMARE